MPMPAIPIGPGPVPEENGAEYHRRVEHAIVALPVRIVAHLVNGVEHHNNSDQQEQKHHKPGKLPALAAVALNGPGVIQIDRKSTRLNSSHL